MARAHFVALPRSIVCAQIVGFPLFYSGPRAFRFIFLHGPQALHVHVHVQRTISMRVRGRAVIFVAFHAFAQTLGDRVFDR